MGDGPVEVYAYYGNDVLEFDHQGDCGPVSLFGGDGADTFRIGAMATIQDYKAEDKIVFLREPGTITTYTNDDESVTTVKVNSDRVVKMAGDFKAGDLDISFGTGSGMTG